MTVEDLERQELETGNLIIGILISISIHLYLKEKAANDSQ